VNWNLVSFIFEWVLLHFFGRPGRGRVSLLSLLRSVESVATRDL
jgi:hypothetical protein